MQVVRGRPSRPAAPVAQPREPGEQELLLGEQQRKGQQLQEQWLLETPPLEAQPRSVQTSNQPEPCWRSQLPELFELLNGHRPGGPTQGDRLPTEMTQIQRHRIQTPALPLVAAKTVAAQTTVRVEPLDPREGQLGFQEERIRD